MIAAQPTPGLVFDPESHTYALDGYLLPSLSEALAKCGLASDFTGVDPRYAWRGEDLHEAIRLYLFGILDESTIREEVQPFWQSAKQFIETNVVATEFCELPVACAEIGLAGTADWGGFVRGVENREVRALIDFKSCNKAPAKAKIEWTVKLALYERLLAINGIMPFEARLNIVLTPEGFCVPPMAITPDQADDAASAVITLMRLQPRKRAKGHA